MSSSIDTQEKYPLFITEDFDEPILYTPIRTNLLNHRYVLRIITAFTDCERISTHMIKLAEDIKSKIISKSVTVEIILGMTKSSISRKKHEDLCRMIRFLRETKGMPQIVCRYISNGSEVHSKVYIWSEVKGNKKEKPFLAYCGSLNYTMNAFYKRRESVAKCDCEKANDYYIELLKDTVDCFDKNAFELIKKQINNSNDANLDHDDTINEYEKYDEIEPIDKIDISLLKANGIDTGYGSGINWGIRPNGTKRNPNQAYIPYNKKDRKDGFFPDRVNKDDKNCPMFKVITKEFGVFHMRLAQQGNKALHSVESNAIIGEWIRKKLNVSNGCFITKKMLDNYGKTYVTFRKYEDNIYLLDF